MAINVSLRDLDLETFEEACDLEVAPNQEDFSFPNVFSIAESRFLPAMAVQGIYSGEEMVGFTMYGRNPEDDQVWIWRFMIAAEYQRSGFGRTAVGLVIQAVKATAIHGNLYSSFSSDNLAARCLFEGIGFRQTTEEVDEEDIWELNW